MSMTEHELLEHERRVATALNRAASRLHEPVEIRDPAHEVIAAEEAEEFAAIADRHEVGPRLLREFFDRFMDCVFEDGPHPGAALRRVYMLARRYTPEKILHMNGTDLGMLFGESRASQSHRMQLIFDRLKGAGVRGNRG